VIKSQLLCQLSYAPTAILLNNLPHRSCDPTDFLPVVLSPGSLGWPEHRPLPYFAEARRPRKSPYTEDVVR
jgi:hypothetical protein